MTEALYKFDLARTQSEPFEYAVKISCGDQAIYIHVGDLEKANEFRLRLINLFMEYGGGAEYVNGTMVQ